MSMLVVNFGASKKKQVRVSADIRANPKATRCFLFIFHSNYIVIFADCKSHNLQSAISKINHAFAKSSVAYTSNEKSPILIKASDIEFNFIVECADKIKIGNLEQSPKQSNIIIKQIIYNAVGFIYNF